MESAKVLRSNLLVLLVLGFLTILTESLVWAAPLNSETMGQAISMEFEEFMAGATAEQRMTVVDTMLDCVDFGAVMVAELEGVGLLLQLLVASGRP